MVQSDGTPATGVAWTGAGAGRWIPEALAAGKNERDHQGRRRDRKSRRVYQPREIGEHGKTRLSL